MCGFIKLHRQITESKVFANETALKVWIWCLLSASYKDKFVSKYGRVKQVKRGQFITGRFEAEEQTGIKGTTWYKWMKFLEKEGMITMSSDNKNTLVTVVKFDVYQSKTEEKESNHDNSVTTEEQQTDSSGTADGQQRDTTKKGKEDKEIDSNSTKKLFDLDLPLELFDVLQDYRTHRKEIKKPLKDTAFKTKVKRAATLLESYPLKDVVACIGLAIEKGWLDFRFDWYQNHLKSLAAPEVKLPTIEEFIKTDIYNNHPRTLARGKESGDYQKKIDKYKELEFRLTNLAKNYPNPNVTPLLLYRIGWNWKWDCFAAVKPDNVLDCFDRWYKKQSDFIQKKGDIWNELIKLDKRSAL